MYTMFSPTLTLTFDPMTVIFDRVFVSFCTPRSRIGAYTRSKCISFVKTTASIPTKFSTTLNTTMRLSWVVQIRAKGIQDGGRLPVKPPNLNLLFEFNDIGTLPHIGPLQRTDH